MYGDHQFSMVKYRQSEMHSEAAGNQLARIDGPVPTDGAPRLGRVRRVFAHLHLRGLVHMPHVPAH